MGYFPRELETESQKAPQRDPREAKMVPRSAPGGPRRPQEAPRAPQDGPKTAPRAAKSTPRAAQRRSQSGLGGHLGPTWRPRGPRMPPGRHFGPLGGRFWPFRGFIFQAPSACCGAFQGASASASASAGASAFASAKRKSASAKSKRRAKSQGQQAARPPGLKDSRARRDERSS